MAVLDLNQNGQNEVIVPTEDAEDALNCISMREVNSQELQKRNIELEQKNKDIEQAHNKLKTEYEMNNILHNRKVKELQSKIVMLIERNKELEKFEIKGDSSDKEVTISHNKCHFS